jgi:tetratricopeptide (TPR) repeat protein
MAALYGPTPVAEAIARCEQALADSRGDKRLEGLVLCLLAPLRAMQGDFEAARVNYAHGRALLEDIGGKLIAASTTFNASTVDMLAGDAAAAEERLRRELDLLEAMGESYLRPTVAAYLAAAVANQGRFDEADRFAALAADLASEDDVISQAMWRSVRARVLAREGKVEEAVELADGAVGLLAASDGIGQQADALLVLSEVLGRAGRRTDAGLALEEAITLYERKGNVVAAAAARVALTALDQPLPTSSTPS